MRSLRDLCSNMSLCHLQRFALVVFVCAIGCSEDTTDSTGGNIYGSPTGGTQGFTGGVYSLQTGGFSDTTPAQDYAATGGAGIVAGKALEAGKNITFVGSVMNGPREVNGVPFPQNNEGHSGWTISQLANIVPSHALDPQPHIILLMIGTNDMYRGNPATAPDRLRDLINEIFAFDPDTLLVVAQLTPLSFSNAAVEAYNAALPAIIDGIAATGAHIRLVDMYNGFSTSMLGDGVHPNQQGYAFMADVWYAAIEDVLN
jgi:hypothetical protein